MRSELYLLRLPQDELPAAFSVPRPVPARDGGLVVEVAHRDVVRHCDHPSATNPKPSTGAPSGAGTP
jgi:hypothetical protein